ncbi:flagellar hook-length control protein FliK [Ensifer sp.]|jgi:chemotaxis protein MotD|uniref:flagellar hook-length control protein FliK n=1 Tax=Ensifer sp. TaxID=1872086 RepID=UPI002E12FE2C|nr:flagellar hook-length control protein FliK [Ensifer sp.]
MRALDDTLRGLPQALAGNGSGRAGGKEQAGGLPASAFEDAVANAGRQKANDQSGAANDDAAAGDAGAQALIDKDNIAKTLARKAHGLAQRAAAIGQGDAAFGEQNAAGQLPTIEREINARRLASSKTDAKTPAADAGSIAGAVGEEELAKRLAALSQSLAKAQGAKGAAEGGDDPTAAADGAQTQKSEMDDLLTLLGGVQSPATTQAGASATGRAIADGQGVGAPAGVPAEPDAKAEAAAAGEGEPDRLFRFARADGKGQAVSMSLSKDGEAAFDSARQGSAKVENVTVLEARRYLGIAMNANSNAVADAIVGEAGTPSLQPSAALAQPGAWTQAGKTLNTLKIQLHPIELGLVTATLRLKDDELQVELKVETGEAFRQLRDDQSEMVKALRAQGFAVDQVNIVFNSGGDASQGGGSQQQAQAQPGQQGRERADGNGQGRQQRQDDGQASGAERWVGNGGTDDAAAGTERSRTGHVYM